VRYARITGKRVPRRYERGEGEKLFEGIATHRTAPSRDKSQIKTPAPAWEGIWYPLATRKTGGKPLRRLG